jgi:hypothetical protein
MIKNYVILLTILLSNAVQSQNIKLTIGSTYTKIFSKYKSLRGTFTVDGNPYLVISDKTAANRRTKQIIYPIEDDINIEEKMVHENEYFNSLFEKKYKKYICKIIKNNGKTYVFYRIRIKKEVSYYFVEYDKECMIYEHDAELIAKVQANKVLNGNDMISVRISPDQSKVLVAIMCRGKDNNTPYIFKCYNSNLKSVLWEKKVKLKGLDLYDFWGSYYDKATNTDTYNDIENNHLLVNNEGRVFFLEDIYKTGDNKHDYRFISLDPINQSVTKSNFNFSGEYFTTMRFRMSHNGNARIILFYNTSANYTGTISNDWSPQINSMYCVEFDGKNTKVVADYKMEREQQSKFYPARFRNDKTSYRLGGYKINKTIDLPNGELAILLVQNTCLVGEDRPFNSYKHGFICVAIFDSTFNIKTVYPFVSKFRGNLFYEKNELVLLYYNEKTELSFCKLERENPIPVVVTKTKEEKKLNILITEAFYHNNYFYLPTFSRKKIGLCLLSY